MAVAEEIFFRGLRRIEAMLETPEYEAFADYVNMEVLTDDWSVLSLLRNLFVVDVGFSMSRFFVLAAVLLAPAAIQAGLFPLQIFWLSSISEEPRAHLHGTHGHAHWICQCPDEAGTP